MANEWKVIKCDDKEFRYIIYLPDNIQELYQDIDKDKFERFGNVDQLRVITRVENYELGIGFEVEVKETGTIRSDIIQKFINTFSTKIYFNNGKKPRTKTIFMFKKYE